MRQRFHSCLQLDRLSSLVYLGGGIGLGLLLAGCRPAPPGAVVPVGAAPVSIEQVKQWVAATVPGEPRRHRFKWLFQNEQGSLGGRGAALIAPPDSLRFDAAGPQDTHPMAAAVVGEQPLWIEPPDALEKLVPNYPLFWAMFGIARSPADSTELRGASDGEITAWQYVRGADTVEYRYVRDSRSHSAMLIAEVRQRGAVVGRAETNLDAAGAPLRSKLLMPTVPAKLDLKFSSTERAAFASDIWRRRLP